MSIANRGRLGKSDCSREGQSPSGRLVGLFGCLCCYSQPLQLKLLVTCEECTYEFRVILSLNVTGPEGSINVLYTTVCLEKPGLADPSVYRRTTAQCLLPTCQARCASCSCGCPALGFEEFCRSCNASQRSPAGAAGSVCCRLRFYSFERRWLS